MKKEKHLSSEEIAMCADALNNNTFENIPIKIQNHIDNCHACANEVILVSEIQTEIEKENISIKPPITNSRFLFSRKNLFITVSLAASLIFGIFYLTNTLKKENHIVVSENQNQTNKQETINKKTTDIKADEPILITENIKKTPKLNVEEFNVNTNLEILIEKNKGTYRGSSINILNNREINLSKTNKIIIDNPENQIIYIEILDNQENQIIESEIINNQYIINHLRKGLYYYKIFNSDFDLIFVGRIKAE